MSVLPAFNAKQQTILIKLGYWPKFQSLFEAYLQEKLDKASLKKELQQLLQELREKLKLSVLSTKQAQSNQIKTSTLPFVKTALNETENSQNHFWFKGKYLFGIPQGAQFLDLRRQSAQLTMELDFPGYSIGGVANGGEPQEVMYSQVLAQTEVLEEHKPRHLLGVGTPEDIVQMVARGIDMFDCVYPTRNARHGNLFFEVGDIGYQAIHIDAAKYQNDLSPINPQSRFFELRVYSKGYLCHLFRAGELLAYRLATLHNLEFYANLMAKIRFKIQENTFKDWWSNYRRLKE